MLRLLKRKRGVLHQTKTSNLYDLLERILNKGMFIRGGKYSWLAIHPGMNLLYRRNTRTNRGVSPAGNNPFQSEADPPREEKRWWYRLLYD